MYVRVYVNVRYLRYQVEWPCIATTIVLIYNSQVWQTQSFSPPSPPPYFRLSFPSHSKATLFFIFYFFPEANRTKIIICSSIHSFFLVVVTTHIYHLAWKLSEHYFTEKKVLSCFVWCVIMRRLGDCCFFNRYTHFTCLVFSNFHRRHLALTGYWKFLL